MNHGSKVSFRFAGIAIRRGKEKKRYSAELLRSACFADVMVMRLFWPSQRQLPGTWKLQKPVSDDSLLQRSNLWHRHGRLNLDNCSGRLHAS